jgi:hypothetical protein
VGAVRRYLYAGGEMKLAGQSKGNARAGCASVALSEPYPDQIDLELRFTPTNHQTGE